MPDYQKGKIYKIVSNITNDVYIGSTCEPTLARKLAEHYKSYRNYQKGKGNYVTSYKIIETDDYEIVLEESYPCDSKEELHKRERYYIEHTDNCVNKVIPTRTHKEYKADNKEKILELHKKHYFKYHEREKQKRRDHHNKNKVEINLKKRKYYENNKDKKKQYYEKNKDKVRTREMIKNICQCGGQYTNKNKSNHFNTLLHKKFEQNWIAKAENHLSKINIELNNLNREFIKIYTSL